MQQSNAAAAAAAPPHDQPGSGEAPAEAPPKQVALAMERLTRAARLIADIRLGADHLIEALFAAADAPHHSSNTVNLIIKEEASMRQHFDDLRALGRQLEDTGVLNGSLKSRGNSWGLHMPLVCPDGAVVAYAWKRQLAGQAGASAVDRTRLALKAFTDQKRRFFPHLEVKPSAQTYELGVLKRHCSPQGVDPRVELREEKTLSDVLHGVEHDMPSVRISTYQRLDWLKRVSSLSNLGAMNVVESSKDHSIHTLDKLREGSTNVAAADQIAVIELLVPSVFRAVVSLHPAGSTEPDAVAFFSPDEGGNYVHARGQSGFHVFKQITEYADKALQYFLSVDRNLSLSLLLRWVCNYETIFKAACGKCMRLQAVDKSTAMFLPAVYRPHTQTSTNQMTGLPQDSSTENTTAYHAGCLVNEARR